MNETKFELIKKKYGHYASWAIWAEVGDTPKSNMGDLNIFEEKNILSKLKPNIILAGLNISKRDELKRPFENFHGPLGGAYKIRYALKNSPFWGGYMTDVIKDFAEKASKKMMDYLRENKSFEKENINSLNRVNKHFFNRNFLTIIKNTIRSIFKCNIILIVLTKHDNVCS